MNRHFNALVLIPGVVAATWAAREESEQALKVRNVLEAAFGEGAQQNLTSDSTFEI